MKHAFLSWSGNLSHKVIEYIKNEILDNIFKNKIETFISSEMGISSIADKTIFTKLTKSDFGIACITSENIEKPWVLFECGGLINKLENNRLYVITVDVNTEMLKRLNDPLLRIQVGQLNMDGFVNLINQICKEVLKIDAANYLNLLYQKWDKFEHDLKVIVKKNEPLPNTYFKQIKYVNNIDDWNLKIPSIFSLYKKELFLTGINLTFLLDLKNSDGKKNFLEMIDSLLIDSNKKIKIMISDIWDDNIVESYKNLYHNLAVKMENENVIESLSHKDSEHYLEKLITRERGETQLKIIKNSKQLEIKKIKIAGDTFVFIDKSEEGGLCYFSLFSSPGGKTRPVFTLNKKDDNPIFNLYSNFIDQGWNSMSDLVWPL
jgi:hypothetical protein